MTVYLDSDFKCHLSPAEGLTAVETDFFNGMCPEYIEGYRLVPEGQVWTRSDGVTFRGLMISSWKQWNELDEAQREYERQRVTELEAENETLLADMAQLVEEVYQSDVEMMGI